MQKTVERSSLPSMDVFIANKILPSSNPHLIETLKSLETNSETVRNILTALWVEQPKVQLELQTTSKQTFGAVMVIKTSSSYQLRLFVQEQPYLQKHDALEPWLGSMLFMALEISRSADVNQVDDYTYSFKNALIKKMCKTQDIIRNELNNSGLPLFKNLSLDGQYMYRYRVLRVNPAYFRRFATSVPELPHP